MSPRSRRALCASLLGVPAAFVTLGVVAPENPAPAPPAPPSFLERPVGPAPALARGSAAMVRGALVPYAGSANLANTDEWGVSVVRAGRRDPTRTVGLLSWGYGSRAPVRFRIPDWARPTTGDDRHLAVVDGDRQLDMWVARRQKGGDWRAGARVVTRGEPVIAPIAATASGFALTAGLLRPEEIARGRIDHALAFTTPGTRRGIVPPALHGDGRRSDAGAMPMGTRIQLDPAADISGLSRPQRIIARALQEYGAYLVDTGGSLALRAEAGIGRSRSGRPKDIWTPVGVTSASLRELPWHRMRVLTPPAPGRR